MHIWYSYLSLPWSKSFSLYSSALSIPRNAWRRHWEVLNPSTLCKPGPAQSQLGVQYPHESQHVVWESDGNQRRWSVNILGSLPEDQRWAVTVLTNKRHWSWGEGWSGGGSCLLIINFPNLQGCKFCHWSLSHPAWSENFSTFLSGESKIHPMDDSTSFFHSCSIGISKKTMMALRLVPWHLWAVFLRIYGLPVPRMVIKEPPKHWAEICSVLFKGTTIRY